jgi:hypothetical protein
VNFTDRVKVFRWRQTSEGRRLELMNPAVGCRVEVLSGALVGLWHGQTTNYTITEANLHVPLTTVDMPEMNYDLTDYEVEVVSPVLGWVAGFHNPRWKFSEKRPTRNHMIYLLAIKEN